MRIALVHGNDGTDVRVGKTCRSLARLGYDTHFIGWDRRPDAAKAFDLGGAAVHVTPLSTSHGRGTLAGQWAFFTHIIRSLRSIRPDLVCAVNEELAFAMLPFRGWLFDWLVCDIYDSLGARIRDRSWPVRNSLRAVSRIALRGADRLIATDESRKAMLGTLSEKAIVIENVPEDPGEEVALRLPQGPVKIWAAGSLDVGRGLQQLLEAITPLEEVRVLSAGWPYDEYASRVFVNHPRVEFHGIVTAPQALELAGSCDAVFSYYAPDNEYMVNASPNKVYDAMSVGRPVLINREVRLSNWVESERVGYVCAYENVICLRETIRKLAETRHELKSFATRSRALFLSRYQWSQMEGRLDALYSSLGRPPKHA